MQYDFSTLPLKPFDAAIFDMDGTILDTEFVFKQIVFDVTAELGYEMTDNVHMSIVGSSHETTNKLLVEAYGMTFPYAIFDEKCRFIMRERLHAEVPVKKGAREFLAELRARKFPVALATSSRQAHAVLHLGTANLLDMFDAIITRDDVQHPKPHPEPYLLAAKELGIDPSRCVAFEDSHSGVRAAHAAGMQTVMIPDLVPPTTEIAALADAVMESLVTVRAAAFQNVAETAQSIA